ncbi:aldo/keto reductase [Sediminibacterium sp. C3]|uniref:aldo/keto reductase n=1 Tax=Sediminibacterium sp. C3 TaxID=1267211 RepID=UPI00047C859E|nr:aldo/keto reductase [Sediminibacterium sp. C3]
MKLILGTAQMGLNYGVNNRVGKISNDESCKILIKADSLGITILDTAEAYGDAHQVIGLFHRKHPNCRFKIITKMPHSIEYNSVQSRVESYLACIGVDALEVLMFHSFESFLNNPRVLEVLIDMKSKGYIKNIGVSVYTNDHLEYLLNEDEISVIQLPFNLLDNLSIRGSLMEQLKAKGKTIHSRSAFLQGLFFKNTIEENKIVYKLHKHLDYLLQISNQLSCSIEELALSYCIQQPSIDHVIIGVDSVNQLEANFKASTYILKQDIKQIIDNIKVQDRNLLNPSLWY